MKKCFAVNINDAPSLYRRMGLVGTCMLFCFVLHGYNLRVISDRVNLSNSSVTSLCQDTKGLLWIGTCDGLNQYNGHTVTPYQSLKEGQRFSGSLIDKIIETNDSILWIQSYHGVDRFNQNIKNVQSFNEFNQVLFTAKDLDGHYFIIKNDHYVFYYNEYAADFERINVNEVVFDNIVHLFVVNNHLYVINRDGSSFCYLITKDEKGLLSLLKQGGYQHSKGVLACFESRYNLLFLDENYDLFEVDIGNQKIIRVTNIRSLIKSKGDLSSIVKYKNDYFLAFKTSGLFRLRMQANTFITEEILTSNGVFCLLEDRYQDIIWIGTDGQGVFLYSEDLYSIRSVLLNHFTTRVNRPIRAVYVDKYRTLWLGSKGDGIMRIPEYSIERYILSYPIEYFSTANSGLRDNSVYVFKESKRDILWIGTEEGLSYYSYKTKRIEPIDLKDGGVSLKYFHDIYEEDSILWLASVGMGVIKARLNWDNEHPRLKVIKRFLADDGQFSSNYFYSLFPDEHTFLMANRGAGIFFLDTKANLLNNVSFEDNTQNEIYSIAKDRYNNYLIGTASGLVEYKKNGKYRVFNKLSGFPNNIIHCILPDDDENFWLSTNNGVIIYNSRTNLFRKYGHLDGLVVNEFSDGAYFKDDETGNIFFGGVNGFVCIARNTNYVPVNHTPPAYFGDLLIQGKSFDISEFLSRKGDCEQLNLRYNQNFFSINFNVIDYLNGGNYNYQYMFEGINEDWVENGNSNMITVTNFAPGDYTLFVKYYSLSTLKSSGIYRLNIKISPPWYLTVWAYVGYCLLGLLLIAILIRSFLVRLRKKKIRTLRILEAKHKEEVHESKLRFFTNVAHEFFTPLTLIYGPCSRIINSTEAAKPIVKYAKVIQQNAERLNHLIQDLINFRKIEQGVNMAFIESVCITDLIDNLCLTFSDLSESGKVKFENNIQVDLYWNTDKEFLMTVLINLLSNAFKYTKEGASVRISTEMIDDSLLITVSNSGKGIKPEEIDKIFDRYSVLDDFESQEYATVASRTGLGLAISHNLVNQLDGEILVASIPDEWTHFTVKLPQKELNPRESAPVRFHGLGTLEYFVDNELTHFNEEAFDERKPTLLIIDDEPEILWLVRELFLDEFNVLTYSNTSDALELLKDSRPNIIICDIHMGEMDGISFTKQLKKTVELAHIPIILISGDHHVEKQIEGMDAGAELYITKPFNADYLITSVKRLMSSRETLKDYFSSPISAYDVYQGKLKHKDHKKLLNDILKVVNQNIQNKDLSAGFVADSLNMSYRSLHRKLKEINGSLSLSTIIRDCRLHISKDLLIRSKLTIDEVAFKSGFNNRVSFFKAFSKEVGTTPGNFREQMQEGALKDA